MQVKLTGLGMMILLLLPLALQAEEAYIIDRLLVGLHKDQSLDSDIVKVIPTGTRVEILKRSGDLALVKDPKGQQGWMDSGYLMKDKPATLVLADLEQENARLKSELKSAEKKPRRQPPPQASQLQALQEQLRDLHTQLASERLKVSELSARLGRSPTQISSPDPELQQRLNMLQEENGELRQQLDNSRGNTFEVVSLEPWLPAGISSDWRIWAAVGGVLLLLAFLAGVYYMDYLNRRRHGGFRV